MANQAFSIGHFIHGSVHWNLFAPFFVWMVYFLGKVRNVLKPGMSILTPIVEWERRVKTFVNSLLRAYMTRLHNRHNSIILWQICNPENHVA